MEELELELGVSFGPGNCVSSLSSMTMPRACACWLPDYSEAARFFVYDARRDLTHPDATRGSSSIVNQAHKTSNVRVKEFSTNKTIIKL